MKVLITGANGFIGSYLCLLLSAKGVAVRASCRTVQSSNLIKSKISDVVITGDISGNTDWSEALEGVELVIHLAACVHQIKPVDGDSNSLFNSINADGTYNLARQAAENQVSRFIFVSSVKVHGEGAFQEHPFTESCVTGINCDEYGLSKHLAENHLREVSQHSNMEFVIIRPPLVYGAGVGANFKSLMRLLDTGIPLPFAGVENKRSMIAVDNLCDFIDFCISDDKVVNETFLISDNRDLSLPQLLTLIRKSMNQKSRLFYLPLIMIRMLFTILGRKMQFEKLTGSYVLDSSKVQKSLTWKPVVSVEDAINKTVKHYKENIKK